MDDCANYAGAGFGDNAAKAVDMQAEKVRSLGLGRACREFTVGEMLSQQIVDAERKLKALADLKASLPGSYLESPASRFAFAAAAFK